VNFESTREEHKKIYVTEEDKTSLFHKDNHNGNHTQWVNIVDVAQLQEPVSEENGGKRVHGDSQSKYREKHSDEMIMKFEEEIKLMEMLLREPEITVKKEKCSIVPSKEEVPNKETRVNFSFQTNYMLVDI